MNFKIKINRFAHKTMRTLSLNAPNILTLLGIAGIGVTTYLTAKATTKVNELSSRLIFEDGTEENDKKVTTAIAKECVKPAIAALGTAACIIGANAINTSRINGLACRYNKTVSQFNDYKAAAAAALGGEAKKKIEDYIAAKNVAESKLTVSSDDDIIFVDTYTKRTFQSNLADVVSSMYALNRLLVLNGYASLADYLDLLGLPYEKDDKYMGWDVDEISSIYGDIWIDFVNEKHEEPDGTVYYTISMLTEPTLQFGPKTVALNVEYCNTIDDKNLILGKESFPFEN